MDSWLRSGSLGLICKIDIEKAYNHVDSVPWLCDNYDGFGPKVEKLDLVMYFYSLVFCFWFWLMVSQMVSFMLLGLWLKEEYISFGISCFVGIGKWLFSLKRS